jgi:hypothetical protein
MHPSVAHASFRDIYDNFRDIPSSPNGFNVSGVLTPRRIVKPHDTSRYASDEFDYDAPAAVEAQASSVGFTALLSGYGSAGGTVRGEDLARLFKDRLRGDYTSLAKLLADGHVFGFKWRDVLWIPMFQFDVRDLSVKNWSRLVLGALPAKLSGWALATWFAQSNPQLEGRRPIDVLDVNLPKVVQAAGFIAAR